MASAGPFMREAHFMTAGQFMPLGNSRAERRNSWRNLQSKFRLGGEVLPLHRIITLFLTVVTVLGGWFNFYRPGATVTFRADYAAEERNMEKYRGIYSSVGDCGGVPTLFVNGSPLPAAAYMTYLEEYNNYAQFADAGYTLFSVPVLFAGRWISATELFKPFHAGIFDQKGAPDFATLDASIARILAACPQALIFPRVNVSMPLWWISENPDAVDGTGVRESLFSQKFRETAADMLRAVIDHVNESDYAAHIVGYQLGGGNTEEWFHFDMNGGYCQNAEQPFNEYLEKYYPDCGFSGLPDLTPLGGKGPYHKNEHLARYLEFANNAVADDICYLASVAKQATGGNVVIGTFYGYSLEVTSPLQGTHALNAVLNCDNIDFICSPNSYIGLRDMNTDWTEMFPADSLRLHRKLCLQECDIRTHLTKPLYERAPEYDEGQNLNAPIWNGLAAKAQTISMIRKSFSRQLIKGNGFWWFDMWGGWYDDPDVLAEMAQMRAIAADALNEPDRASVAEVGVFVDESAYKYLTDSAMRGTAFNARKPLGYLGAPYDLYDVSDFADVYQKYKAVVFLSDTKTAAMTEALALCRQNGVRYLSTSRLKKDFTARELRAFCQTNGVHIYCRSDDIVYVNQHYIAVHSVTAGEKTLSLNGTYAYRALLGGSGMSGTGDTIRLNMNENETVLFQITKQ